MLLENWDELMVKQPQNKSVTRENAEEKKKLSGGKKSRMREWESMKEVTAGGLFDQGRVVLI